MDENETNNAIESEYCPTCYGPISLGKCIDCEIENEKKIELESKKENRKEEEEEYDWREHKR